MRIAFVALLVLALATPGHASTGPWAAVARAIFRLYLLPDARAGLCTAWAIAWAVEPRALADTTTSP